MAEKTIPEKLQIKPGDRVWFARVNEAQRALVGELPADASESSDDPAVAIVFVDTKAELLEQFGTVLPKLLNARAVWFCYPKGNKADLNRDTIITETGAFGWRPNSNVAVDDAWSAVRVRPLKDGEEAMDGPRYKRAG